ncbi:unnamed protein product, partial [Rotaria sp. Silwood2]
IIQLVNTTVSSSWTNDNPIYARPGVLYSNYYYDTFDLTVSMAGTYAIGSDSTIDTYGSLYNGSFVPGYPQMNLLIHNGGSESSSRQFQFQVYLEPHVRYILVATTYGTWTTGSYSVVVFGPQRITLIGTTIVVTTPLALITDDGYRTDPTSK